MKKILKFSTLSAVAAVALGGSLTASAQIVTNGDFSANGAAFTNNYGYTSTSHPGNGNPATPTDFSVTGGVGVGNHVTGIGPYGYPSSGDPADYVYLQSNGSSVTQTLTGLHAGYKYQLSYVSAPRAFEGVFEGNADTSGEITISNTTLATVGAPATTTLNADFTKTTVDFVANTTGNSVLTLLNTSAPGDDTVAFSNLVITQIGVPEPTTYALLGLGALALVMVGRRTVQKQ